MVPVPTPNSVTQQYMKKKPIWIGGSLVFLFIIATVILAATFKLPELVGVDAIEVHEVDGKGLQATVKGRIYNGNLISLSARKLDYIVTYHDTLLGMGHLPKGCSLPAGDTTLLELPIALELQAIFALQRSMLRQARCKLDIHMEGEFTSLHCVQGLDFSTEVDPDAFIRDVLRNAMGDAPLSFDGLTWKSADWKSAEFGFVSVVRNPLDILLELKALHLDFFMEGDLSAPAGMWQVDRSMDLLPRYSTRIPGTARIQFLAAGKSVAQTIFTGEVRYPTRGSLTLQIADLPFELPIKGTMVIDPKTRTGRWE